MQQAAQGREEAPFVVGGGVSALQWGKVGQRHVLCLGELNDSLRAAGERTIWVFDEDRGEARQLTLFPAHRTPPGGPEAVQMRLDEGL